MAGAATASDGERSNWRIQDKPGSHACQDSCTVILSS